MTNKRVTVQILNALLNRIHHRHGHPRHGTLHPLLMAHYRFRGHLAHGDGGGEPFVVAVGVEPGFDDFLLVRNSHNGVKARETKRKRREHGSLKGWDFLR